jgi:O-methyltransferase domain/Dimerisation domain
MSGSVTDSPAEVIFRMAVGLRNTQALYVVAKLGIPDLLARGPLAADELAGKTGAHSRSLFRLMRALAAQRIFTQDPSDRFGLTPLSQVLRSDDPHSMRWVAINFGEEYYRAAGELLHTVRTGETGFNHLYGKGHFDYLAEHPESSEVFNAAMAAMSARGRDPFGTYSFQGKKLLVDVGGGRGHLTVHVLGSNPGLKAILYDLPHGVAEAPAYLKAQGVADRCRIITGSFFDSIPSGDIYLLSRVLHDWPDEKASLILANCRKSIGDDGILLIREAVIPEGDIPSEGKQIDLTMLFMLGGAERTEEEWRGLLAKSGFRLEKIVKTGGPFDLIEAKPV